METLQQMGKKAKEAGYQLAKCGITQKNEALCAIAKALEENIPFLLAENKKDLEAFAAKGGSSAFADRLALTEKRILDMAEGVRQVMALDDPIGEVLGMTKRPNGLVIGKKRVPLGVIGIIYEARPNVTVDAAVLCLKASNVCILRGGSEALNSNRAIVKVMTDALDHIRFPQACIQLVEDTSRETAAELMRLNEYLDVLIPRGGKGLIQIVVHTATVPVIETGTGNCHVYIEKSADISMAAEIITNAKTSRPSVCNAAETLLVDEEIAKEALPAAFKAMKEFHVEWRGCPKTKAILPDISDASEEDYETEYNDYILAVKVVSGLDEAIAHINRYGTGHSEAIVTSDYSAANRFLEEIDAAAVYVNASTRFTDGFEFGFGAEIGISTQKLHARGPMGLKELTTTKYIIYGDGQVRR